MMATQGPQADYFYSTLLPDTGVALGPLLLPSVSLTATTGAAGYMQSYLKAREWSSPVQFKVRAPVAFLLPLSASSSKHVCVCVCVCVRPPPLLFSGGAEPFPHLISFLLSSPCLSLHSSPAWAVSSTSTTPC
jgi:hypothetical protein